MRWLGPVLLVLCLVGVHPAFAGVEVDPDFDGFVVSGSDRNPSVTEPGTTRPTGSPPTTVVTNPKCFRGGLVTCDETAVCDDGSEMVVTTVVAADGGVLSESNNCPVEGEPLADEPEVTPGLVAQALQRLPLPAAELVVQPSTETMVNIETNFFTEQGELSRSVRLLGREVELRIWPAEFAWQFGDGGTLRTTEPGAAYPALDVTHVYRRAERVRASLDVTYAAEFRVGDGAWRPVAGTVTIAGEPQGLRVLEARPVLTAGD